MDTDTWIEDGTPVDEPVTTETPVEPETIEADAIEVVEPETVEAAEEVAEIVQTFIEGRVGDEVFQIPEGLQIPQKHGDETTYVPVADVLKSGMLETDYRQKTAGLADERRSFEREQSTAQATANRNKAREEHLNAREAEIKAALSDPESAARFEVHLQQMRDNPQYREVYERDWSNKEVVLERDELRASEEARIVREASTTALGWIDSIASEFPGVDQGRVRAVYGQRLNAGQASLDISDVRSVYQAEADYLKGANQPLHDQLATLSAQVAALTDTRAAEERNETTQHAVNRAKAPPVNTGPGAVGVTPPAQEKFGVNQLDDRISAWNKAG